MAASVIWDLTSQVKLKLHECDMGFNIASDA